MRKLCLAAAWLAVFAAGMAVCSAVDLRATTAVFRPGTAFSRFFDVAGLLPTAAAGIFAGSAALVTDRTGRRGVRRAEIGCAGFLCVFTLVAISQMAPLCLIAAVPLTAGLFPAALRMSRRAAERAGAEKLREIALLALFAAMMATMGQTAVKICFNRPRFIALTDPETQFTPWWVTHLPVLADSAFPSGHVSQAALLFLLPFLKEVCPKLRRRGWDAAFLCAAVLLTGCTMLGRMMAGAHYLTDVWAGLFLTLFSIAGARAWQKGRHAAPRSADLPAPRKA